MFLRRRRAATVMRHAAIGRWLYHEQMPPLEIDPHLSDLALAEAVQKYPRFAGRASRVLARPLLRGFAWQVEWAGEAPAGQEAWEFQNAAIRAYKRLANIAG